MESGARDLAWTHYVGQQLIQRWQRHGQTTGDDRQEIEATRDAFNAGWRFHAAALRSLLADEIGPAETAYENDLSAPIWHHEERGATP